MPCGGGANALSDERIDDLAIEIRGLRAEMRDGFRDLRFEIGGVRGEVAELRSQTQADFGSLYGEIGLNRRWLGSMRATMLLGFVALLVEIGLR